MTPIDEDFGKDIYRDGVWCIADMSTDLYTTLSKKSQTEVPWTAQGKYGQWTAIFMCAGVLLFTAKNLMYLYNNQKPMLKKNCYHKISAGLRYLSYKRTPNVLCKYFEIPSTLGNVLVILGFIGYVLCVCLIPKFWYRVCRGFGSPPLAVRAGVQSFSLLPFLIVMAGKVNVISAMVGLSYEKMNVYHRWVSIMCFVLAIIHAVPFFIQDYKEGGAKKVHYQVYNNSYYYNGLPPFALLFWMCFGSYTPLRNLWYELWLHVHWMTSIALFVTLFIHCGDSLGTHKYLEAAVVLWVFQLMYRAVSKTFFSPNTNRLFKVYQMTATKFMDDNECFELMIKDEKEFFDWAPGQHIFVRIPGLRVLDNHPFSICNIKDNDNEIKLIVKPKKGLTRKIYNSISFNASKSMKVLIDGPYGGCVRDYKTFTDVFLMATGSGITAVLPFLLDSLKCNKSTQNVNVNSVRLDWVVKSEDSISWVEKELQLVLSLIKEVDFKIKINIYTTRKEAEVVESTDSKSEKLAISGTSGSSLELKDTESLHFIIGKPDFSTLMEQIKSEFGAANFIVSSGTSSMKYCVGNTVAAYQSEVFNNPCVNEVYLHTESFGW